VNDRELFQLTDYNVFHTGGGYHIVKKAFERMLRNERPECRGSERDELTAVRLHPSCHILKRVGPCHTVSSFLNTASVAMSQMQEALGKVIMVFTYGSGCAASMYQLRVDDIAYFDPLEVWFLKRFYRNSIKMYPGDAHPIHMVFVETWMKFEYKPFGRQTHGQDLNLLEDDVYYLGEIDKFGRRFYHRGGLKARPLDKKYELPADTAEGRPTRKHWGPLPEAKKAIEDVSKSDEARRRQIEYDMTFDHEAEEGNFVEIGEFNDTYQKEQKVRILKPLPDRKQHGTTIEPDGQSHSYQIVGTWSSRTPVDMEQTSDVSWYFDFTLGENRWEEFYLLQDGDPQRRIYPHEAKGSKESVAVGPHDAGPSNHWFIDCRDRVDVPEEQLGMPGDRYRITFRWKKLKEVSWQKLEGEKGEVEPSRYSVAGSWTDFELQELRPETGRRRGWHSTEVQMTSLGLEFRIVRNEDFGQSIYPIPAKKEERSCGKNAAVCGPDALASTYWKVDGILGGIYKLKFYRDPEDCESTGMRVDWTKVDDRPVVEVEPTYYLVGPFNEWGQKDMRKMRHPPNDLSLFEGEVEVKEMVDEKATEKRKFMMPFKIVQHKMPTRCVHPDKDRCSQLTDHKVVMDDKGKDLSWYIGLHPTDKAKEGDVFTVKLQIAPSGEMSVSWSKS